MIRIAYDERCECAMPRPSGTFYQGRESCLACSWFIVRSPAEYARLDRDRLASIWPMGEVPKLTKKRVREIVREELVRAPHRTNADLMMRVGRYGSWDVSESTFQRLTARVRLELSLRAPAGGRPRREARAS